MLSRRRFLAVLAACGAGVGLDASARGSASASARYAFGGAAQQPPFEEVPPARSGISWVHSSGRSPMAHLPETVGAGCAFLDYDGDGWMDIYLVNSGPCDFFDPKRGLRNALYRNNR